MVETQTEPNTVNPKGIARHRRAIAVAAALISAIIVIGFLAFDVVRKIDQQSTASSDNVQWSVAQINVEYLHLLLAAEAAKHADGSLQDVRRRYDVFYSRLETMKTSPVFAVLRKDADFAANFDKVWSFIVTQVPLIDGNDERLAQELSRFATDVKALRANANSMGLAGIRVFARRTDAEREGIANTLLQVSILTLGLIVAMGVMVATLARMNTAVKQQARASQLQSERVKAVFATSLDAIIVADEQGRILEFNAAAEDLFGYSAAETLGKDFGPLIIPPHLRNSHRTGMQRFAKTGEHRVVGTGRVRLEAMRKSTDVFPVELAISMADGANGHIFISFLRDLSRQVADEQELLRARDDALAGAKAKAELLAVMSHEMRTPLNGMLGTMDLLKDTKLTTKQQQYHRIMETSGRLLLHHVNDVLDIVRLDSGKAVIKPRPVNLATLIGDIVESQAPVASGGGNALRATLPADGRVVIECDPVRLRQVLLNLVGNALKFTRNGEVMIEAERLDSAGIIEFRVTDTGIGIREEDRERIFEDFVTLDASYSRTASGTGLGLGIVRRWVQAMGGEFGVESEPGEGSLFWVRLPLTTPATLPESIAAADQMPPATVPTRPLSILVVEDNAINRLVVREMLEKDGHTVVEAHDGEEGVSMAATRRWDIILMDVSMPRKDGVAATIDIRATAGPNAATPIVALTAHALPSETDRFQAAGMQEIMTKPVSRAALREVVQRLTAPDATKPRPAQMDSDSTEPLLDNERLAELQSSLGKPRAASLLQTFVTETDDAIADWRSHDLRQDRDSARVANLQAEVHRISGSAALLGAARLRARLAEVETACKSGNPDRAADLLQHVTAAWPTTRSAIMDVITEA